jgi:hypothetical protein
MSVINHKNVPGLEWPVAAEGTGGALGTVHSSGRMGTQLWQQLWHPFKMLQCCMHLIPVIREPAQPEQGNVWLGFTPLVPATAHTSSCVLPCSHAPCAVLQGLGAPRPLHLSGGPQAAAEAPARAPAPLIPAPPQVGGKQASIETGG